MPVQTPLRRPRRDRWPLAKTLGIAAAVALAGGLLALSASSPKRERAAVGPGPVVVAARTARHSLPRLGTARVVETDDVGDPFILPAPKGVPGDRSARYVLFWTTDWRSNVPTAVSSDLVHWRRVADALPVLPIWASQSRTMTWAPAALRVPGGWVLYYSTQEASSRRECIGAAFSTDAAGPYRDPSNQPLVCQLDLGGSIDPSVVPHAPGGPRLVWKSDSNAIGRPAAIWEERLGPDGRSLLGSPHRLLVADEPWQHGIVEGPAMLPASRGGWWLFYSGGSWQSNTYATGVAWCATVAGRCQETSDAPLLAGLPTAVSPGGLDTFTDTHGRLWAAYSAFPTQPSSMQAAMAMDRVLEIAPFLSH